MKLRNVVKLADKESRREIAVNLEEELPPWRVRLRWWLSELLRPVSIVRLVGPGLRPLERHEFETLRAVYERRVL